MTNGPPTSQVPQSPRGRRAGFLSSSRHFLLPVGAHIRFDRPAGYYIDFRQKAIRPEWPPSAPGEPTSTLHVDIAQAGLGSFERFVAGEGEQWLEGARRVGDLLVEQQVEDGPLDGGWRHEHDFPHTLIVRAPWLSAMAQGEGASLLVRLHAAIGEERYLESALRALHPLALPVSEGGVLRDLGGGPFLEEYPTNPGSYVLNGAIFAIWGLYDVALTTKDAAVRRRFEEHVDTLAREIGRWDTGRWSRYDLFPHRLPNVASSFYHRLHISQLAALQAIAPRPQLAAVQALFERYADSRASSLGAFAAKAAFRLVVPRSPRSPTAIVRRLAARE